MVSYCIRLAASPLPVGVVLPPGSRAPRFGRCGVVEAGYEKREADNDSNPGFPLQVPQCDCVENGPYVGLAAATARHPTALITTRPAFACRHMAGLGVDVAE